MARTRSRRRSARRAARSPRIRAATKIPTRAASKLPDLRLAEVLGSLSLATDLATGAPLETALRTCLVATHLSRILDLPPQTRRDTYYASLLRHLGCTAWAHEAAAIVGGDDHDLLRTFETVDASRKTAVVGRAIGLGRGQPTTRRARAIAGALVAPRARDRLAVAQCAQAAQLATDLGLGPGVATALAQMYEHHDGSGSPHGLQGEALTMTARVLVAAQLIEALHRRVGRDGTLDEVRRRHGRMLHPTIASLVEAEAGTLWAILEAPAAEAMLAAEPRPWHVLAPGQLDAVALAFARFTDLKTPYFVGHSPATAALAVAAGQIAGCPREELELLHRAALLHDLGSVAVANGVWEHRGPLGAATWAQVHQHAQLTEQVLARSPVLAPLAAIAGAHHERLDGSGYHRGTRAADISRLSRLVAAADALVALRAERPHRTARTEAFATRALEHDAREGRLCREAVAAVVAASREPRPAVALPSALTAAEADVLGYLARGRGPREIATALGLAPRVVKQHVAQVHDKTGATTRAAAALFAVRHDLPAPDRPRDPPSAG